MNTQEQAGKMAPYEESTQNIATKEQDQAKGPSPRQLNPKVIVVGAASIVGLLAVTMIIQSSKKQQARDLAEQNQETKKTGVVGVDDAKGEAERLALQQRHKDEQERERKEREARAAQDAKEPKPEQVLDSQVNALEAQLAQPMPGQVQGGQAGVGGRPGQPQDPWVQARQQAQMQAAQTFYQERAAALRAPLFFSGGGPKDSKQDESKSSSRPKPANDEAAFLAQIQAAQQQPPSLPQAAPQGFTLAGAQGAQLAAMSGPGMAQSATQQAYDRQEQFFERGPSAAKRLGVNPAPRGPYVEAGTVVEIVLETGIDSQLPGVVLGRVSQPVYDPEMNRVLIPSGTRVLGTYQSQTAPGQDRAQVSWLKLMLTDGRQVSLPNEPGVDLSGMSGFEAEVDNHTDKLLLGASLSAVFSATGAVAGGPTNQFQVRPGQQAIYGATQPFQEMGEGFAKRYLEVKPTLKLAPGQKVGMLLTQDLAL